MDSERRSDSGTVGSMGTFKYLQDGVSLPVPVFVAHLTLIPQQRDSHVVAAIALLQQGHYVHELLILRVVEPA